MPDCAICLVNIEKSNECFTNCNHLFCKDCLNKLFKHHLTCPLCRREIEDYTNEGEKHRLIKVDPGNREGGLSGFRQSNDDVQLYISGNNINTLHRNEIEVTHLLGGSLIVNICLLISVLVLIFSVDFNYCCYLDDDHLNDTNHIMQYNGLATVCT